MSDLRTSKAPSSPERSPTNVENIGSLKQATVLEELQTKFGAAKTKQEIIHALESCQVLHRIPLPEPSVSIAQSLKDFYREKVLLNDVAFIPDKHDTDRSHGFSQTLYVLLEKLTRDPSVFDVEAYGNYKELGNVLMQRACRTAAGSDSFFTVQKMLCTEGTFLTQKMLAVEPPVLIDVFLAPTKSEQLVNHSYSYDNQAPSSSFPTSFPSSFSQQQMLAENGHENTSEKASSFSSSMKNNNNLISSILNENAPGNLPPLRMDLCARIQVTNFFAIFDVESVDEIMGTSEDPIPWLDIESVVIDETNFKEGSHWRKLHLIVTNPETGVTFSSSENMNSVVAETMRKSGRLSGRKMFQDFSHWMTSNSNSTSNVSNMSSSQHNNNNNNNNPNQNNINSNSSNRQRPLSGATNLHTDDTVTTGNSSMLANRGELQLDDGSSSSGGSKGNAKKRLSNIFRW
jgi:hypothetical protein